MKNVCCVNIREIHSNFVNHLNQVNQLNQWLRHFVSEQRSSFGHHRCVTPLYHIPVWVLSCVMEYPKLPALHKHLFTGKGIGLFI